MCIATLKRGAFICLLTSLVAVSNVRAQDANPVACWSFDRTQNNKTPDSVSGIQDTISGNHRLVRGVKGQAIVMDGYTTCACQAPIGPLRTTVYAAQNTCPYTREHQADGAPCPVSC